MKDSFVPNRAFRDELDKFLNHHVPIHRQIFTETRDGVRCSAFEFISQEPFRLRLYVAHAADVHPDSLELTVLNVVDQTAWEEFVRTMGTGLPAHFHGIETGEEDAMNWRDLTKSTTGEYLNAKAFAIDMGGAAANNPAKQKCLPAQKQ